MDVPLPENTYLAPKVQAPVTRPLLTTPEPGKPAPQFKYVAPIMSKINSSDIIIQVLSEKVWLSVKELLVYPTRSEGILKKT